MKNFNRDFIDKSRPGVHINSPPFELTIGSIKTKWSLQLYPNGDWEKGFLSIYLVKVEESAQSFKYSARFSIMCGSREAYFKSTERMKSQASDVDFGWGFPNYISHEALLSSFNEYVDRSQLTFRVSVMLTQKSEDINLEQQI